MPSLTPSERQVLLAGLEASEAHFRAATDGLTEAEWERVPAPGKWNAILLAEHLALTEQVVPRIVRMALEEPAWVSTAAENEAKDAEIIASLNDDALRRKIIAESHRLRTIGRRAVEPRFEVAGGLLGRKAGLVVVPVSIHSKLCFNRQFRRRNGCLRSEGCSTDGNRVRR